MYGIAFPDENRSNRMSVLCGLLDRGTGLITNLRLRDAWVEKRFTPTGEQPVIAVYTRNGRGNRDCFCSEPGFGYKPGECSGCRGDQATEHPDYVADADDDVVGTYRTYWFTVPEDVDPQVRRIIEAAALDEPRSMDDQWQAAVNAIGGGQQ